MSETLSLCMIVKNEEQLLGGCLDDLRPFVDECLVVDTGSTDRTVEIAREYGATVAHFPWTGIDSDARNVYLEQAHGSWVMVVDADETIARNDRPRLRELMAGGADAYRFAVRNYTRSLDLLGRWRPNNGAYAEEEQRSGCPGYSEFDVVRLFRRRPDVRYAHRLSRHTSPIPSLQAAGCVIHDTDVVIHHLQCLKGGDAFVAAKQIERLEWELTQAAAEPDDFLAHLNAGRTLFTIGRDDEAMRYLSRAIEIDASSTQAWLARGALLCETARERRAIGDLVQALRCDGDSSDAWTLLGITLHRLGRFRPSVRALSRALDHQPRHPVACNSLGVVYADMEAWTAAEGMFRRALAILPGHPPAACNLADLCAGAGRAAEAREILERAERLWPDDQSVGEALTALREAASAR